MAKRIVKEDPHQPLQLHYTVQMWQEYDKKGKSAGRVHAGQSRAGECGMKRLSFWLACVTLTG